MNDHHSEMEEINLAECLNLIIKRKKIVLSVFFSVTLITVIALLSMSKSYRATASIMVTPSKMQIATSSQPISLSIEKKSTEEYVTRQPTISLATHKILLKSNAVIKRIIDKLGLIDKLGNPISPYDLSENLFIARAEKEIEETNILRLEVNDFIPDKAAILANTWAQEYVIYVQELISGEIEGTGDFIANQFEVAKKNLLRAEEAVKNFRNKINLDLTSAELAIKKSKLNDYKKEVIEMKVAIETKENLLHEYKKEIEKQGRFIVLSKAITDDALWQLGSQRRKADGWDRAKLQSEEINPIYQDLQTRIVNTEIELNTVKPRIGYLQKEIELTGLEIEKLQTNQNQNEFELAQLTRQVDIYKRTYDNFSARVEEARIAKSAQLGEVKIISPALVSNDTVKQNRQLKLLGGGVFGLVLGVLAAFFAEFWKKSRKLSI